MASSLFHILLMLLLWRKGYPCIKAKINFVDSRIRDLEMSGSALLLSQPLGRNLFAATSFLRRALK